jgi:hypothetical protein
MGTLFIVGNRIVGMGTVHVVESGVLILNLVRLAP